MSLQFGTTSIEVEFVQNFLTNFFSTAIIPAFNAYSKIANNGWGVFVNPCTSLLMSAITGLGKMLF